jgi:hypothetical protein
MGARLRTFADDPVRLGFWAFSIAVLVQFLHQLEHLAQIIQKHVLGWKDFPGLLGRVFDFETVHLLYNVALFLAILAVFVIHHKNPGIWRRSTVGLYALSFAVVFQGYHCVEHIIKTWQYIGNLQAGLSGPEAFGKGILGAVVPVIELHFWFNSVVIAALLVSYIAFRPSLTPPELASETAARPQEA